MNSGEENRNYRDISGICMYIILGLYRDNGKEMEATTMG